MPEEARDPETREPKAGGSESREPEFRGSRESREANRLYWNTKESVNGIAERLELSKSRLYDLLTPLPVEAPCPACGAPLGFAHRTARDQGLVSCAMCGFAGSREEIDGDTTPPSRHPAGRDAVAPEAPRGDAALVGAALAGVAVGLALGWWLRS